jgi:hypothetical protein
LDNILNGKLYKQKGQTVTAKEWEKWIADIHSRMTGKLEAIIPFYNY